MELLAERRAKVAIKSASRLIQRVARRKGARLVQMERKQTTMAAAVSTVETGMARLQQDREQAALRARRRASWCRTQ